MLISMLVVGAPAAGQAPNVTIVDLLEMPPDQLMPFMLATRQALEWTSEYVDRHERAGSDMLPYAYDTNDGAPISWSTVNACLENHAPPALLSAAGSLLASGVLSGSETAFFGVLRACLELESGAP